MSPITQEQINSRHKNLDFFYVDFVRNGRSFQGIKIDQYVVLEMIGKGAFAQVYRGVDEIKNIEVAIKVLNKREAQIQRNPNLKKIKKRLIEEESKIMMKFNSPHILKCYQCFENRDYKVMVLQFCTSGSLQDKIMQEGNIAQKQAIFIMKQIINGIAECHRQKIIHRDLKPDNILIHNGEYKIADFGFSKELQIQNQQQIINNTRLGTMVTMAPQVLKGQRYGLKADIWSIGVIFFHMLFGECPFKSDSPIEMVAQIMGSKLLNEKEYKGITISDKVRKFLSEVLVVDIQKRLGWRQVLGHQIFQSQGSVLPDKFQRQFQFIQKSEYLEEIDQNLVFENQTESQSQNQSQKISKIQENEQQITKQSRNLQIHPEKISYINFEISQYIKVNDEQQKTIEIKQQQEVQQQQAKQNNVSVQQKDYKPQNQKNQAEINVVPQNQQRKQQTKIILQKTIFTEQIDDRTQSNYKRITAEQRKTIEQRINRDETQVYKWAQRIHIECKKTEVLYQKIIKPIQEKKLINLSSRDNIEMMYLICTRCLNNISPINDAYNKRKNNPIILNLKDNVQNLYQKVLDIWMKYSNKLTSKQNEKLVIALDFVSKIFQRQKIKKKDKFLSGIENMLEFRTQPNQQAQDNKNQNKDQNKDLLDYNKTEQISFTLEYIEVFLKELRQSKLEPKPSSLMKHLQHYREICLIDFEDLRKRAFEEYLSLLLL